MKTQETVTINPEVGNGAFTFGLTRDGYAGVVCEIARAFDGTSADVVISWTERKPRQQRSRPAAQRDRGATARRVVTANWLDAAEAAFAESEQDARDTDWREDSLDQGQPWMA